MLEEPHDVVGDARSPPLWVPRDEAEHAVVAPPVTPLANGLPIQAEPPTRRQHAVDDGVRDDGQALFDAQAISGGDRGLSFSGHWALLLAILQQRSHS